MVGVLLSALPLVVLAVLLSAYWEAARGRTWVGGLLMLLAGAPLMSLYRTANSRSRATEAFVRTLRSLGVSRWQAGLSTIKLSSRVIVTQLGAQASGLLTLAFVVEHALDLPGLGPRTILALQRPDLNGLMAIAVFTVLFVGLLHALSEWLLDLLDPRRREGGPGLGEHA
jgi:ABC-type dipeptide/oligopeptide/nickel transport system permease component